MMDERLLHVTTVPELGVAAGALAGAELAAVCVAGREPPHPASVSPIASPARAISSFGLPVMAHLMGFR
jgi:hypothetical protein